MLHRFDVWLIILAVCLHDTRSQQLGVAIGNNINGNDVDIVRHERYEYNPPGAMHQPGRGGRGGPFNGILPGLVITFASSYLQWWNEGRAVRNAKLISAAEKQVVELDSTDEIDPINNGKLIHITGYISTEKGLTDPHHGLRRPDALQLITNTEAYQWKETKKESRTRVSETETRVSTEYRYHKVWTGRHRDSFSFQAPGGHYNPQSHLPLGTTIMTAKDAKLSNGFHIAPDLVDQIANQDIMMGLANGGSVNIQSVESKRPVFLGRGEDLPYLEDAVIFSNKLYYPEERNHQQQPSYISSLDDGEQQLAISNNKRTTAVVNFIPQPQVGDVRVGWKEVTAPQNGISILAEQQNDILIPWYPNKKDGSRGGMIYSLFPGQYTAKEMLEQHISKNKLITKVLRIGGWIGSYFGLSLVLSCIPAIVGYLPLGVGTFLQPLANIATSTIALAVSAGLSGSVIALAWLRFRPLLSTVLAFSSTLMFFGPLIYARIKRKPEVKQMEDAL